MMMGCTRLVLFKVKSESNGDDSHEFKNHRIEVQGCKDMEDDTLNYKLKTERQTPHSHLQAAIEPKAQQTTPTMPMTIH